MESVKSGTITFLQRCLPSKRPLDVSFGVPAEKLHQDAVNEFLQGASLLFPSPPPSNSNKIFKSAQ